MIRIHIPPRTISPPLPPAAVAVSYDAFIDQLAGCTSCSSGSRSLLYASRVHHSGLIDLIQVPIDHPPPGRRLQGRFVIGFPSPHIPPRRRKAWRMFIDRVRQRRRSSRRFAAIARLSCPRFCRLRVSGSPNPPCMPGSPINNRSCSGGVRVILHRASRRSRR